MDINERLKPNVEECEKVLETVKGIVKDKNSDNKDILDSVDDLDITSASGLVVVKIISELEKHEFIKVNIDVLTESGVTVGDYLLEEGYPIDIQSIVGVLKELFGDNIDESNIIMLSDMILTYSVSGIDELKRLAKEFESESKEDSED